MAAAIATTAWAVGVVSWYAGNIWFNILNKQVHDLTSPNVYVSGLAEPVHVCGRFAFEFKRLMRWIVMSLWMHNGWRARA
eukprot:2614072-Pyramimonas_sp.AAC.1